MEFWCCCCCCCYDLFALRRASCLVPRRDYLRRYASDKMALLFCTMFAGADDLDQTVRHWAVHHEDCITVPFKQQ